MAIDLDEVLLECEEHMEKGVAYLKEELRGIRTGRASTGMVDFIKVEAYGTESELRQLALVSVPEPTQLLIKPFDPSTTQAIVKALQSSGLGLNPMTEGKQIRVTVPALSGERRRDLITSIKQMAEKQKVVIRNARRDANKHVDQAEKDKSLHISEDAAKAAKDDVQDLVKKYESQVDDILAAKTKEIEEI